MKLEGWKARVVLIAALIIIGNLCITLPIFVLMALVH